MQIGHGLIFLSSAHTSFSQRTGHFQPPTEIWTCSEVAQNIYLLLYPAGKQSHGNSEAVVYKSPLQKPASVLISLLQPKEPSCSQPAHSYG